MIYFVTGQFTIVILVSFVIACAFGEITRAFSRYGSFRGNALAFIFFSLGMTGSPLPIWLMRDSFIAQITEQGMPDSYIESLKAASCPSMLSVLFAAPIVCAFVGALITKGMFKKHFTKAGIV